MDDGKMETKKIISLVKGFNPYCEHITLSTIFYKMRVGDAERYNVVNFGPPGTGKSFSSIELLKRLDFGNDIILDNTTTRRGLFETFMDYPDSDILIDECSVISRDKGAQDMIKLAMEGKELTWTKKGSVETTPPFKGNVTLNINESILDAVTDRCFVNMTLMNKKMALDFVDGFDRTTNHDELIAYAKEKINERANIELTKEEVEYIKNFVKRQIELNDDNLGYSRRTIVRMISYFKRVKHFFGGLTPEVKTFIEPYASIYVENKRTPTIIESLLGDAKIVKADFIKLLSQEGGFSERHSRKLIDDELTKGTLVQYGRLIYQKVVSK
jgi:hypothetical protein